MRSLFMLASVGVVVTAWSSSAQTPPVAAPVAMTWAQGPGAGGIAGVAVGAEAAQWLPFELMVDPQGIKGAPYSATAVTETTQVLGDGNRIARRMEANLYRDGEGRTRREQGSVGLGPIDVNTESRQMITIDDPVKGEHFILEPEERKARRMKVFVRSVPPPAETVEREVRGERGVRVEREVVVERRNVTVAPALADTMAFSAAGSSGLVTVSAGAAFNVGPATTEPLGTTLIEGVQAEGTRTTVVIPAGQIGNERPIEIVSERWFSPDLKTVVMSRHSDPRLGETIYRLTKIVRAEPDPALFQVPADFTTEDIDGRRDVIRTIKRQP